MTRRELAQLETLLKKYRADHTWSIGNGVAGHDPFRKHADATLSDVRRLRTTNRFYDTAAEWNGWRDDFGVKR